MEWRCRALGIVGSFCLAIAALASPIEPGRIEVLDGDTIRVGGTVYRLIGFDTPEGVCVPKTPSALIS